MKNCSMCKVSKDKTEFSKDSTRKDGLQHKCRQCQKILSSKHYKDNHIKYKEHRSQNRLLRKEVVWDYLIGKSCVDCGENDPVVLEFDHVIGSKLWTISEMCKKAMSITLIIEEMAKCEIRCANCHRRRHSIDGDYWRHTRKACEIGDSN